MEQVDKKVSIIIYLSIFLIGIFFMQGCAPKKYESSTKSFDQNITKDQLLHAVKRVFALTDKEAFIIDSYRNEINITKPKLVHRAYTMNIQNDNFDFKVDENKTKNTLDGTISIYRTYGVDEEDRYYIKKDSFPYDLFWDRVEYLLGLKKDWRVCNYVLSKGFMCDILSLDNTWAKKEDQIDLNTTNEDINTTIQTIKIAKNYKDSILKDKPKEDLEEVKYYTGQSEGELNPQEPLSNETQSETTYNLDTNSSLKRFKNNTN